MGWGFTTYSKLRGISMRGYNVVVYARSASDILTTSRRITCEPPSDYPTARTVLGCATMCRRRTTRRSYVPLIASNFTNSLCIPPVALIASDSLRRPLIAPGCHRLQDGAGSLLFVNESRLGLFDTHRVSRHHVLDLEYSTRASCKGSRHGNPMRNERVESQSRKCLIATNRDH